MMSGDESGSGEEDDEDNHEKEEDENEEDTKQKGNKAKVRSEKYVSEYHPFVQHRRILKLPNLLVILPMTMCKLDGMGFL
jgi:hypothetical protein